MIQVHVHLRGCGFKSHQLHGDKEPQIRGFVEKSRVCGFFSKNFSKASFFFSISKIIFPIKFYLEISKRS